MFNIFKYLEINFFTIFQIFIGNFDDSTSFIRTYFPNNIYANDETTQNQNAISMNYPAFSYLSYLPFKDNVEILEDFGIYFNENCVFGNVASNTCSVWTKYFNGGHAWLFGWNWEKK